MVISDLWNIISNGYTGYANYLWYEITHPSWHNYFYALTFISLLFFLLEIVVPWRKKQFIIRKDFWLDLFYMYFNFFIFSLIIFNAGSDVFVHLVRDVFSKVFSIDLSLFNPLSHWPIWAVLVTGFILRDFIQWWTHRLLHRLPWLWNFHKVHHSVKEMGFAAHLRYHWMETIVYRTIEYLPLAFIGVGLYDFFIIHIFSLIIGHYNHANISISSRITGGLLGLFIGLLIGSSALGINVFPESSMNTILISSIAGTVIGVLLISKIIKYIFNSPEMHIWHHVKELPADRRYGVNFGISLALWDFIFNTSYIPHDGQNIELGFPDDQRFPKTFFHQITFGFFNR